MSLSAVVSEMNRSEGTTSFLLGLYSLLHFVRRKHNDMNEKKERKRTAT
jgi:hypothetical protein